MRHPELDSGSHSFFKHCLILLFKHCLIFFFITYLFLFFHKNYYHFSKGRETARSPKPAVSLPLNPSLFGHGLRRCLKNLADSEVNSHYNKIFVILTQYLSSWLNIRHPELDSGSHSFFFKHCLILFLFLLCFYFFHKNYYYFSKGRKPAQSPKPAVFLPLNPSFLGHGLRLCLKNLLTSYF